MLRLVEVIVALAFVGAIILGLMFVRPIPDQQAPYAEMIRMGEAERPPVTDTQTTQALAETNGFQALVSYTDTGFEPQMITVKQGETIRFTNNSSNQMHIVVNADTVTEYQLNPQQYAEVTFKKAGLYQYNAAPDTSKGGTIVVK